MNVATASRRSIPDTATAAVERVHHGVNTALALYLLATAFPMYRWWISTHDATPPALHLAALLIAARTARRRTSPGFIRDWLPLLLGPFLYIELRWLIPGAGRPHADATIIAWEHVLFGGGDLSSTLATRFPSLALSELLHACYASYYLLVYLPPALLYLQRQRADFARTMLALGMVYAICFATYLVFPVDGPRFLVGAASAPEGPVRGFVLHLLATGSSRGTAFPSSHIAASVVASLCALHAGRRMGLGVSVLTAGLAVATVYGGFHYAVDAVAGLMVGVATWLASRRIWAALERASAYDAPGEHRASRLSGSSKPP